MAIASNNAGRRGAARKSRSLPVVSGPKIKRSTAGYWRAGVLVLVHLAVAIHIAHWYWGKTHETISPIEPSESMAFSKEGVINAGFVFFSLAILSTLVLGRWFCGWGCHLVALQDLARWALSRFRIRPKPIRSRVLGIIPLLAFLYMFVAPLLGPMADQLTSRLTGRPPVGIHAWSEVSTQFTTTGFWDTFPGWVSALLTFIVCGFIIIYVLGAKGFCFTGCPYGAIFGVADRFAPLRIRVTDDCTQSGHCTAVCTSNVRVHEEVRDFRMVVDSGCMKCLDCVKVCPNDALFVGWGRPVAFGVSPVGQSKSVAVPKPAANLSAALGWPIVGIFVFAALLVFHGFDLPYRFRPHPVGVVECGMLALIALGVLALLRPPRHAPRAVSLGEEVLLGVFFLASMVLFRGELVPFLFSLGLSVIVAYVLTQACMLVARRQLSFQGWRLKQGGVFQPAALGFVTVVAALLGLTAYAGVTQAKIIETRDLEARLDELTPLVAHEPFDPGALAEAVKLNRELVVRQPNENRLLLWGRLLCSRERFDDVAWLCEQTRQRVPKGPVAPFLAGMLETLRPSPGSEARATALFEEAARNDPGWSDARRTLAQAYLLTGRPADALRELDSAARAIPTDPEIRLMLAGLLAQSGDRAGARAQLQRAVEFNPNRDDIRAALESLGGP